ncbi:hypothetical protein DAPPUDRAFT_302901 [Daphnia pulex]|uniref:Uncharacterized protein n=1 Tax=Daphnia pulex TaxID=6669 RepID=E9HPX7_DAPPU|nr:hypothetical protein DAPPUDRAFT_302901 [Daphnia pulex]|eukprot:EFX66196.1 hypothetical protein DAPPUDRAFT_302901 [Daphnia pulex]
MAIKSRTQPERKRETRPAEKIKKKKKINKKNKKNKPPHTPKVEGKKFKLKKRIADAARHNQIKIKPKHTQGKFAEFVFCFVFFKEKEKKKMSQYPGTDQK